MNKKSELFIMSKVLFGIFLVIFVAFVAITIINSRIEIMEQKKHFSTYGMADDLIETVLNSPCIVSEYFQDKNYQLEEKGFLSVEKLNLLHNENSDIYCIDSFDFIYSIEVEDLLNKKSWRLGLREEPVYSDSLLQTSLPVAINYNYTTIHPGRATLIAYQGGIPAFYGSIKMACITQEDLSRELETPFRISYNNTVNRFCVDRDCFSPYFSCRVDSFTIKEGKSLIYMDFKDNRLTLK